MPKPVLQKIKINPVMQAHKPATTENAGESEQSWKKLKMDPTNSSSYIQMNEYSKHPHISSIKAEVRKTPSTVSNKIEVCKCNH